METKKIDQQQIQFIQNTLLYPGDDPYDEKLVNRPEKGVVWGLGGQLMRMKQNFFQKGKWPEVNQIIAFLQLEQGKDIIMVDLLEECQRTDISRYGIILSSFSCRHNYRIAYNLIKALQSLQIPGLSQDLNIDGRRDDQWLMVSFNDIMVHCFVEEARDEIDLEWKWKNKITDEQYLKFEQATMQKQGKPLFQPLGE